jgi:hypothetical protein
MSDFNSQPEQPESDPFSGESAQTYPEAERQRPRPRRETFDDDADHSTGQSVRQVSALVGGLVLFAAFAGLAILLTPRRRPHHSFFADLPYSPSHWLHAASDAERDLVAAVRRYAARLHSNDHR